VVIKLRIAFRVKTFWFAAHSKADAERLLRKLVLDGLLIETSQVSTALL